MTRPPTILASIEKARHLGDYLAVSEFWSV